MHPMVVHESSAGTASACGTTSRPGQKPMAVEIFTPFMTAYEFFQAMGVRVLDNGHGPPACTLDPFEYSAVPGYERR